MSWENELEPQEKNALKAARYAVTLFRHEYGESMMDCVKAACEKYRTGHNETYNWLEVAEDEE